MNLANGAKGPSSLSPFLIGAIVAFSGFCSLVYQVVWDRTLRYNFGGDSVSSAIVTATFLLGLGIGAFIFGKWHRRAFVTYALVEISIGLYAIASFYILSPLAIVLGQVFNYSIADVEGLRAMVVVACILFLLPPCILMGGTLPLMFNCFIRPGAYQNKTVGLIYGLNTAGAAIGILAVPFLFLNHISIPATLLIVGSGNILLGMVVWLYGRYVGPVGEATETAEVQPTEPETSYLPLPFILALSFISGFITLSFEISLLRTVTLLAQSSPYTFPFVLMPFLLALALGSVIFTRFKQYSPEAATRRVGLLFISAMLGMLSGVLIRYFSPFNLPLLIIPLPLLLGGVFPLLLRLASSQSQDLPGRTGRIYLSNSVGAFAGAMISQFYGFQYLGSKGLIVAFFLIGIIAGISCLAWKTAHTKTQTSPVSKYLTRGLGLLIASAPLLIPAPVWDVYTFNHTGPNVDKIEGVSGVAVIDWEANHAVGHIEVNGQYMSALPHHPKHIRLESIALAMPRREKVVMLGLGSAMVRELVNDPEIKQLDLVDWSHELPLLLQTPQANTILRDALNNPKVRLFHADARVAVSLYEDQTFDLAIDNLGYLGWAGSTSIKSISYFKEIRRILKPAGVFVLDPNCVGVKACNAILAGLIENFRYVQTHQSGVVIASDQPIEISPDRATEILQSRGQLLGLSEPYADWLLHGFQSVTAQDLKDTKPIFDELLIYEYTIFGSVNYRP